MISNWEVTETNQMIEHENLDVRTIALGISLLDCADSDLGRLNEKIYRKITTVARDLTAVGRDIEQEYSIPVVNKRISVTPIALVGGGTAYLVSNSSNSDTTEVNVSNRKPTEIQLKTVDGKNPMTDAELYAANVNSVVSINITATSDPNFFGQTTQTAGAGSGFILTPDGYIVTNYHVVGDADTVKVTLYNGDSYDAQYIGLSLIHI